MKRTVFKLSLMEIWNRIQTLKVGRNFFCIVGRENCRNFLTGSFNCLILANCSIIYIHIYNFTTCWSVHKGLKVNKVSVRRISKKRKKIVISPFFFPFPLSNFICFHIFASRQRKRGFNGVQCPFTYRISFFFCHRIPPFLPRFFEIASVTIDLSCDWTSRNVSIGQETHSWCTRSRGIFARESMRHEKCNTMGEGGGGGRERIKIDRWIGVLYCFRVTLSEGTRAHR